VWALKACETMADASAGSSYVRTATQCYDYDKPTGATSGGIVKQGLAVALAKWYE